MYWGNKIKRAARIVSENKDTFTEDDFYTLMPQFTTIEKSEVNGKEISERKGLVPEEALNIFLDMANKNILQARWFEKWKWACSLYVAHYSSLYLRDYKEHSESIQEAGEGKPSGIVNSSSLGDASISYDNSVITQSLQKWGIWATTNYGQQLVNEAKILGIGGAFII